MSSWGYFRLLVLLVPGADSEGPEDVDVSAVGNSQRGRDHGPGRRNSSATSITSAVSFGPAAWEALNKA